MAGVAVWVRRAWGSCGDGKSRREEGCQVSGSQRFNMPGRGAGLLANAESLSAVSWCRGSSHPDVGRRLVEGCCLGLPIKSLPDGVDDCTDGRRRGVCAFLSKRWACDWKAVAVGGAAAERTPK